MEVGDYVNRIDTDHPTGKITEIRGTVANVYWGTSDKIQHNETVMLSQLKKIDHEIVDYYGKEDSNGEPVAEGQGVDGDRGTDHPVGTNGKDPGAGVASSSEPDEGGAD